LVVQFKRFACGGGAIEKNCAPVTVNATVDLSPFTEGESAAYSVRAVVNHSGTLGSGHYTAVCARGLTWYVYNDSHVSSREPPTEKASETVYLAFLSKTH
jgi:ubiquitin C-terminal hydrolase